MTCITVYHQAVPTADGYVAAIRIANILKGAETTTTSKFCIILTPRGARQMAKAMRDEDSVEMLDYLLDGRVVDLGYLDDTGTVYSGLHTQLASGNTDLASFFEKRERSAEKQLAKLLAAFEG